jgi:hypothetical protein
VSITAIVAIAGAVTTSVAAVAGPLASWLIAKGGREHEERLTREARYFEARRSVYEDAITELIDGTQQMRVLVQRMDAELETYRLPEAPEYTESDAGRLRGRIVPVASEPVVKAFEAFADAAVAFWTTVVTIQSSGDEGEVIPLSQSAELQPLLSAALDARVAFERAVRVDMQAG